MYKTKLVHCCDVVPNLVVEIEICNFDLFHCTLGGSVRLPSVLIMQENVLDPILLTRVHKQVYYIAIFVLHSSYFELVNMNQCAEVSCQGSSHDVREKNRKTHNREDSISSSRRDLKICLILTLLYSYHLPLPS